MDLELVGKRALVTGSTAGIGYAIALGLAKEGARVTTFVASPLSSATNGAALRVEGGLLQSIL